MKRIGVFGGTFDPIHVGHLVAACWCKDALDMDLMLLVVANKPWQKLGTRELTPAEDRFTVVAAAIDQVEGLQASRVEIDRGGPSFTADTLRELKGLHREAELFLVVGSDVAAELGTWHRLEEMTSQATLVVVDRGGVAFEGDHACQLGWRGAVRRVRMPLIDVSSSELRERLRSGRSVDYLIPRASIRRIRELGLYSVGR